MEKSNHLQANKFLSDAREEAEKLDGVAREQESEGTAASRAALVNPAEIERALHLVFGGHGLLGTIPVVEVYDVKHGPEGRTRKAITFASDLAQASFIAKTRASALAREDRDKSAPAHVAIIPVTFGKKLTDDGKTTSAKLDNVEQVYALRVDHDKQPDVSCARLRTAGLEPTFSTASGGYVDGHAKRHDYFCFVEPVIGEDIKRAREINRRLVAFCESGDPNGANLVQPMRCPGGLHRKAAPRVSTIVEVDEQRHTLDHLERILDRVAPETRAAQANRRSPAEKRDGREQWRENIRCGEELHDSINRLAASLAHDGRTYDEIVADIEEEMHRCEDIIDTDRWNDRYADIPRAVQTAISMADGSESFDQQQTERELIATMRDPIKLAELRTQVDARIAALKPNDYASSIAGLADLIGDIGTLRLTEADQKLTAARIAKAINQPLTREILKQIGAATARARKALKRADTGEGAKDNTARLEALNERFAVARTGTDSAVAEIPEERGAQITFIKPRGFHDLLANESPIWSDGKLVPLTHAWWIWPKRRTYLKTPVFDPGCKVPTDVLNLFRGFAVEPKQGDWSLLRRHIFENICRENPRWFAYFMSWLADLFQNHDASAKPGVALALSGKKGTGKSKVPEWLRRIMPANAKFFSYGDEVWGSHNTSVQQCKLAILEEAFWAGDKRAEGRLKHLITGPTLEMNPKFVSAFTIDNHCRLWLNTNEPWNFPATGDERRLFALGVSTVHMQDTSYFAAIDKQMSDGGLEAMFYDLLHLEQPDWINLRQPPDTPWLVQQIELSLGLEEQWLHHIIKEGAIPGPDALTGSCRWPEDEDDEPDEFETLGEEMAQLGKDMTPLGRAQRDGFDELAAAAARTRGDDAKPPQGYSVTAFGGMNIPKEVAYKAFLAFTKDLRGGRGAHVTKDQLSKKLERYGVTSSKSPRDVRDYRTPIWRFPSLADLRAAFARETQIGTTPEAAALSLALDEADNGPFRGLGTAGLPAEELERFRAYGLGASTIPTGRR